MTKPLAEAKQEFFEQARRGGAACPCCGRFGKVYKRKIHSGMAAILVLLYRHQNLGFTHVLTLVSAAMTPSVAAHVGGGDFAKLRYWGLIEEETHERVSKGKKCGTGRWRITGSGAQFVEGTATVQRHVWVYSGQALGFHGEHISIHDALGDRFSYAELMRPS
jgi:hypothetical protein